MFAAAAAAVQVCVQVELLPSFLLTFPIMHMNVLRRWQTRGKNNNVPSSDCVRSHIYLHAVMLGKDQTCSERAGGREGGGNKEEKQINDGINQRYGVPPPNALALSSVRLSASSRDINKHSTLLFND